MNICPRCKNWEYNSKDEYCEFCGYPDLVFCNSCGEEIKDVEYEEGILCDSCEKKELIKRFREEVFLR